MINIKKYFVNATNGDDKSIFNVHHFNKKELLTYVTGKCKHGLPYQQHKKCFEHEILHGFHSPKIGIFDLEFQNFQANYGIILTYSLKEYGKNKIYANRILVRDLRSKYLDKNLCSEIITNLSKFDVLVTYWGTGCDLPYIRTRSLKWKLNFPQYGYIKHIDLYGLVKNKLSLNRYSLDSACQLLGIKGKNHVIGDYWIRALTGHVQSLNYILDHNKRDVIITEKLFNRIMKFSAQTNRSI